MLKATGGGRSDRFLCAHAISWLAHAPRPTPPLGRFSSAQQSNSTPPSTPCPPRRVGLRPGLHSNMARDRKNASLLDLGVSGVPELAKKGARAQVGVSSHAKQARRRRLSGARQPPHCCSTTWEACNSSLRNSAKPITPALDHPRPRDWWIFTSHHSPNPPHLIRHCRPHITYTPLSKCNRDRHASYRSSRILQRPLHSLPCSAPLPFR